MYILIVNFQIHYSVILLFMSSRLGDFASGNCQILLRVIKHNNKFNNPTDLILLKMLILLFAETMNSLHIYKI